uniref:Putative secreted protein n=1 Tax=Ixodes ricinus TaxID=34613 RepID=A0A6B0U588_IXORI
MRVGRLQAGLLVLRLHRLLAAGHRAGVEISQVLPGVESWEGGWKDECRCAHYLLGRRGHFFSCILESLHPVTSRPDRK